MNRAMFSGVAGMKTHQTRMDVIGNNIANVNTYGYKTQRAVFSDIFYQTLTGASQGDASRGGTNPSTIGYGSTLGAIQTQMNQSSMQSTGFGLDVAITGEGFLQVMDPDGNIYYTKAGLVDYDANGYLVDVNGNFVLGSVDVNGAPNIQKIKLDNMGAVNPAAASAKQTINGITYTLSATNTTKDGNVGITITSGDLPIGQLATAVISNTGAITVMLNSNEIFTDLDMLNREMNAAIRLANNNQPHAAGTFTLSMADAVSGSNMADKFVEAVHVVAAGVGGSNNPGGLTTPDFFAGGEVVGVSTNFPSTGPITFNSCTYNNVTGELSVSASIGGKTYTGTITNYNTRSGNPSVVLQSFTTVAPIAPIPEDGSITLQVPNFSTMLANTGSIDGLALQGFLAAPPAGFLTDHTFRTRAMQQANGLTGAQIAIANFAVTPGKVTGFPTPDFNFKETSNNFVGNGLITDFKLTYDDTSVPTWTVSMTIGGILYEGAVPETSVGSSLLLKNLGAPYDSLTLSIPRFERMTQIYRDANSGADPVPGVPGQSVSLMDVYGVGNTATPAVPADNLGLTSVSFGLSGGTIGGPVTLDQLTSISIGADGTVSASHPDKGTVSVGKISLANFANPRGLLQAGTNYYTQTVNSGEPVLCDPGTGGSGALKANALEMSNVDLSNEFADMIVTQRGFQANTRIITVSDQMLEELVNIKR